MSRTESANIPRPRGRDRHLLVAICWVEISFAAILFALSIIANARQPRMGLVVRPDSGVVLGAIRGEPAAEAGIRAGDRIVEIDGRPFGPGTPPFYDARPGIPLPLTIERDGHDFPIAITPDPPRSVFSASSEAEGGVMHRTSEVLRVAVNIGFLLLGVAILWLRSNMAAARVASLAMAFWVGANSLFTTPGFGAIVDGIPLWMEMSLHIADVAFTVGFLGLMLHFALLFPRAFPAIRTNPQWQLVPYAAALPLAILGTTNVVRFFVPAMAAAIPSTDLVGLFNLFGPLFIGAVPFLLVQQYRYTSDANDRRRLSIVLVSLIPGTITWLLWIGLSYLSTSPATRSGGRAIFWLGAATSGAIFSWAIVRHEMFGIRLLVRKSIQYALARGTLLLVMVVPSTVLGAFLWLHRDVSIGSLLSRYLGALILIGAPIAATYRYRRQLREMIDRRFFREEYDAHRALVRLASMVQRGSDILFLGRLALTEIERALHPTHLSFWRFDTQKRRYHSVLSIGHEAKHPAIYENHPVVRYLASNGEPLQVDLVHPRNELRQLSSEAEVWIWLGATEASLLVPLTIDEELFGMLLLGPKRSEEPYSHEDRELLKSVASQLALTEDYIRLEGLARYDPLTEALNRHSFYSLIEKPGARADDRTGCVAVVDVNDLKTINDSMGHAAGDIAIRQVASNIRSIVRADDLVFRWGGDEFLVVVFGLREPTVRERFSLLDSLFDASGIRETIPLSVSYGIAPFADLGSISTAIDAADREMYQRKAESSRTT